MPPPQDASRPDQRILATNLDQLPNDLNAAEMDGPTLTFYGLAPRQAAQALTEFNKEHA